MTNFKNIAIMFCLVFVAIIIFTACSSNNGKNKDNYVGSYKSVYMNSQYFEDNQNYKEITFTLTINNNNTFEIIRELEGNEVKTIKGIWQQKTTSVETVVVCLSQESDLHAITTYFTLSKLDNGQILATPSLTVDYSGTLSAFGKAGDFPITLVIFEENK